MLSGVVNPEGLLSPRAYCVAAAVAFLIAGSGTASAVMEEIGPSTTAFPDDGVAQGPGLFRDGDGFGTSKRDFTSLSGGGNIISSVGSDNGPDDQGGGGPLPTHIRRIERELFFMHAGRSFPDGVADGLRRLSTLGS